MADNKEKLERLRKQIEAAAKLEADRALADAQKQAEAVIEEEKALIEKERGGIMLSKFSKFETEERKRVSESRFSADRRVLLHRNALVDELFSEIKEELTAFTSSSDYEKYLAGCAEMADNECKINENVTVYCRKADEKCAVSALKKYPVKIETDRNILLGGLTFKYADKGIYIDLTLDTAFDAEREAFSAKAEMQL